MTSSELAYLAGIIDGEGSLYIARQSGQSFSCRLVVSNTSTDLMEWLVSRAGGRSRLRIRAGTMHGSLRCNHDVFEWRLYCREAETLLQLLLPYLVVKRRRAELWLVLAGLVHPRGAIKVTNGEARERAYLAFREG